MWQTVGRRLQVARTLLLLSVAWGGGAQAVLINRGTGMIYDSDLDITWMQDAQGDRLPQFTQADGRAAASSLRINGIGGWRLPSMDVNGDGIVVNCSDPAVTVQECKDNEFGFLFHYELQGVIDEIAPGLGEAKVGDVTFQNISLAAGGNGGYWSDSNGELSGIPLGWYYEPGAEVQGMDSADEWRHWWAVRAGDVAEPTSMALVGLALCGGLGVGGLRGRRSNV